jgi:hypothetical protein
VIEVCIIRDGVISFNKFLVRQADITRYKEEKQECAV